MTKPRQITAKAGEPLTATQLQQMEMEGFMNLVREAAVNPNVDPEKLGKLLDLRERVQARSAEQQYNDAMHRAQEQMRVVAVDKRNPDKGNRYASVKAIDKAIRPIYTAEGFSVSFDTGLGPLNEDGTPKYGPIPDGSLRILMDIAHAAGHKVQKHVDIPVETTGAQGTKMMTKIHATGSAMSYGKRYLMIFGFNLAIGEQDDDDGNAAGRGSEKKDQKYKEPTPKSDKKKQQAGEDDGGDRKEPDWQPGDKERINAREKYPGIKKAEGDQRIHASSLKTLENTMKRLRIPEGAFAQTFGFQINKVDKTGLNEVLDWMKEAANA